MFFIKEEFISILESEYLNISCFRNLCSYGVPHENDLKSNCWKILLNYLPQQKSERQSVLDSSRDAYRRLANSIFDLPDANVSDDHPLSQSSKGKYKIFNEDSELLRLITCDCKRLHPEIDFFVKKSNNHFHHDSTFNDRYESLLQSIDQSYMDVVNYTALSESKIMRKTNWKKDDLDGISNQHWEVIRKILFIYAKLTPGIKYFQGMNEIIAPIYYVFSLADDSQSFYEPDTFYCFHNIMIHLQEYFVSPIRGSVVSIFMENLRIIDEKIWKCLIEKEISVDCFVLRWISMLFAQDFILKDLIFIWDFILSSEDIQECSYFIGFAILFKMKKAIIIENSQKLFELLNKRPKVFLSINVIINTAKELFMTHRLVK